MDSWRSRAIVAAVAGAIGLAAVVQLVSQRRRKRTGVTTALQMAMLRDINAKVGYYRVPISIIQHHPIVVSPSPLCESQVPITTWECRAIPPPVAGAGERTHMQTPVNHPPVPVLPILLAFRSLPPALGAQRQRCILFSRIPVPGKAKTRLIPALGPAGAARTQILLTEHVLDTYASVPDVETAVLFGNGPPFPPNPQCIPRRARTTVRRWAVCAIRHT